MGFLHIFVLLGCLLAALARIPTPISDQVLNAPNNCGVLKPLPNAHLLRLSCAPGDRGFAHGYLLASQIIDWSVSYQLNYNMGGDLDYYNRYSQWISGHQFLPEEYRVEARGIIEGMKASNVSMYVPEFGRDFMLEDIYVINSYLEGTPDGGAMDAGPYTSVHPVSPKKAHEKAKRSKKTAPACTQFVAWGHLTSDGETLAGRNMDGETDDDLVTVSHLIVFAIDPTREERARGRLRMVSVMWPGHIGTLSGMNEDGVSMMLNCGTMGSGPSVTNITAIEWTIRDVLANTRARDASPDHILSELNRYRCTGGGVSAAGSVIVVARPNDIPTTGSDYVPGFIAELDRYGGMVRVSEPQRPAIFESNHFLSYGVDPSTEDDMGNPKFNFGVEVGFSSRWRLEAIRGAVESINRTTLTNSRNRIVGLDAVHGVGRVMRHPAHGYTEHSIAFAPRVISNNNAQRFNGPRFALANSNPKENANMWDAPYNEWVEYSIEEMFLM